MSVVPVVSLVSIVPLVSLVFMVPLVSLLSLVCVVVVVPIHTLTHYFVSGMSKEDVAVDIVCT